MCIRDRLATNVEPEYLEDVGIFPVEDGSLSVFFHKHETKNLSLIHISEPTRPY